MSSMDRLLNQEGPLSSDSPSAAAALVAATRATGVYCST
jgi:hypothetical protein